MHKVIVDLDGTISDDIHRRKFLYTIPKDWDGYMDACAEDEPVEGVVWMVRQIHCLGSTEVEIWTGRPERLRDVTLHWLRGNGVPFSRLRMRPDDDWRDVNEIKGEWLDQLELEGDSVRFVVDDRNKCVAYWRSRGLLCLQVANHQL